MGEGGVFPSGPGGNDYGVRVEAWIAEEMMMSEDTVRSLGEVGIKATCMVWSVVRV